MDPCSSKALITFAAGLVGFLSPCVLPLLPGYVGYMTGAAVGERVPVRKALPGTLAFVAGLTVVFVSLGATASVLSRLPERPQTGDRDLQRRVHRRAGAADGLRPPLRRSCRERRFYMRPGGGVVPTFLLGAAFAFGWTPCIGPTLGAALNLAATSDGLVDGIGLLFAYSLGIGLPFVAAGLGLMTFGGRLKRHAATIQLVGGAVLVGRRRPDAHRTPDLITIWAQRLISDAASTSGTSELVNFARAQRPLASATKCEPPHRPRAPGDRTRTGARVRAKPIPEATVAGSRSICACWASSGSSRSRR